MPSSVDLSALGNSQKYQSALLHFPSYSLFKLSGYHFLISDLLFLSLGKHNFLIVLSRFLLIGSWNHSYHKDSGAIHPASLIL